MFSQQKLATVEAVARRAGENPDELEDDDIALIEVLIDIVSADVRSYGSDWPDIALTPDGIKAIVVKAAARGFLNLAGYAMERGDMLSLQRSDLFADGESLSRTEVATIKRFAATGGVHSMPVQRDVILSGTCLGDERGGVGA